MWHFLFFFFLTFSHPMTGKQWRCYYAMHRGFKQLRDVKENNLSSLFHLQCQCDEERDCNYYTFNAEVKLCSLFATCDSYFDCSACVTGDEQCCQELGGDCSLSPTPEKLVMIIGGDTGRYEMSWTDDIELVSLDSSPIPECLSSLNPFPFGTTTCPNEPDMR